MTTKSENIVYAEPPIDNRNIIQGLRSLVKAATESKKTTSMPGRCRIDADFDRGSVKISVTTHFFIPDQY